MPPRSCSALAEARAIPGCCGDSISTRVALQLELPCPLERRELVLLAQFLGCCAQPCPAQGSLPLLEPELRRQDEVEGAAQPPAWVGR